MAFRVPPELKNEIQGIADSEARSISQVCELLLSEAVKTASLAFGKMSDLRLQSAQNREQVARCNAIFAANCSGPG